MACYITYGEFQNQLHQYYLRTGNRMQFIDMANYLYQKGLTSEYYHPTPMLESYDHLTDSEFDCIVNSLVVVLEPDFHTGITVVESDIIPNSRDVFLIRHPRYTHPQIHTHDYFEINYVVTGTCHFTFEETNRSLTMGEICIIAPNSKHDIIIEDESIVFTIMLRKSTFERTFFSLLSQKDLLSYFFRTILQDKGHANFLQFSGIEHSQIKYWLRNAMVECHRRDSYSNISCISWINLTFASLLRNYNKTIQFYDYQINADFSLILQYIQFNYRTITLSSLAELFHYTEPHLSTMIKQHTGHTFTELVKRLRMSDAANYLLNTTLKINEIAEKTGYASADHFSRVFRSYYHVSPLEYRKNSTETLMKPMIHS